MDKSRKLKIAVIGNAKAGKTAFIRNFIREPFSSEYQPTNNYEVQLFKMIANGENYQLQLWDCGSEYSNHHKYSKNAFFKNTSAALLIFDICDANWRQDVPTWISEAHENNCYLIYAIATKIDVLKQLSMIQKHEKPNKKAASLLSQKINYSDVLANYVNQCNEFFNDYQIKHFFHAATEDLDIQVRSIFVQIEQDQQKISRMSLAQGRSMDNSIIDSIIKKHFNSDPSQISKEADYDSHFSDKK